MKIFTSKTSTVGDSLFVEMSGSIDEHADFSKVDATGTKPLVIDLAEVTRVNSIGIRTWMTWFKAMGERHVTLQACPKNVVDQFNLVANFLPKKAIVKSFFVPYFCEDCQNETFVLLEQNKNYVQGKDPVEMRLPETPTCSKCQKPTELDVNPKVFFRFLKNA